MISHSKNLRLEPNKVETEQTSAFEHIKTTPEELEELGVSAQSFQESYERCQSIAASYPSADIADHITLLTREEGEQVPALEVTVNGSERIFVEIESNPGEMLNTGFSYQAEKTISDSQIRQFQLSEESSRVVQSLAAYLVRKHQQEEEQYESPGNVYAALTVASNSETGPSHELQILVDDPEMQELALLEHIPIEHLADPEATIVFGDFKFTVGDWAYALAERDEVMQNLLKRDFPDEGVRIRSSDQVFSTEKKEQPHLRILIDGAEPRTVEIHNAAQRRIDKLDSTT